MCGFSLVTASAGYGYPGFNVYFNNPYSGETLSGNIQVQVHADRYGYSVSSVVLELYKDGHFQGYCYMSQQSYYNWTATWVTPDFDDGSGYMLRAIAFDWSGYWYYENCLSLSVDNIQDKYAIIVGINDYQDAGTSDLDLSVGCAVEWYKVLEDMGYNCQVYGDGHEEDYTSIGGIYTGDATEENVRNALQNLYGLVGPGDKVAFIFSGHGHIYDLAMWDYNGRLDGTYSTYELIPDFEGFEDGVEIFTWIEACHSGSIGIALETECDNYQYIYCATSAPWDESSTDGHFYLGNAWRDGFPPTNGYDPELSMETIYDYAVNHHSDPFQEYDGNPNEDFYL